MKTVMTILADLVRSLVLSGLMAAGWLALAALTLGAAGFGLWQLWKRVRASDPS